jgi:hypothetical protein
MNRDERIEQMVEAFESRRAGGLVAWQGQNGKMSSGQTVKSTGEHINHQGGLNNESQ